MDSNFKIMKNIIFPVVLFFLLGLSACETFLVMELPPHQPKYVINTSLEVGLPIHVFVSKSRSVLEENDFENVGNATVEIIVEGERTYTLQYGNVLHNGVEMKSYYTEELEVEPGKTYEVVVSGAGMPTARGKATVPVPVPIKSVELRSAPREQSAYVDFVVLFDDPVGENYYELNVHAYGMREVPDWWEEDWGLDRFTINQFVRLEPKNPIYQHDMWNRLGLLFDDNLFSGREGRMEFHGILAPNLDLDVTVYLRSVTEGYFRYDMTSSLQDNLRGDPIAQPVQVYNNIENGFGIVKAAATQSYEIKFNNRTE
jgi:hypothetical protein